MDAVYDKTLIGIDSSGNTIDFFEDLFDPSTDTVIEAHLNYKTGPALITLEYKLTFDPANPSLPPSIASSVETKLVLF